MGRVTTKTGLLCCALWAACAMGSQTDPKDASEAGLTAAEISGLWVGTVAHRGEGSPFALEIEPGDDGAALVKVTIPAIRLHRVPLGRLPLVLEGDEARLGSLVVTLDREDGTLRGVVPASLAPVYELAFTLHRVEAHAEPERRPPDAPRVEPVWTFDAGSPLWAGATVAGDLVLAGADDGRLHALDRRTGERRWVSTAGGAIRTRAAVADGTVYLQADDGLLYAVSTDSGELRWKVRVVDEPVVRKPFSDPTSRYDRFGSDVLVVGDRLYLGTHGGRLLCLDRSSGEVVWSFQSGDAVLAAPTMAGGSVYFGSYDGKVYALEAASGRLRWQHDTGKPVVSTPAVADGRVIVGSRSYDLLALDATSGDVVWQRYVWFSWIESSPVVREGVVYVGSSDAASLFAFDVATGRTVWQTDVWGWAWGQPAVTADRVYLGTAGQRGYPAPHRGGVLALDRKTGRVVWQFTVEATGDDTFGFTGSPVVSADLVVATGLDGRVVAFER